jgi:thioredoxin
MAFPCLRLPLTTSSPCCSSPASILSSSLGFSSDSHTISRSRNTNNGRTTRSRAVSSGSCCVVVTEGVQQLLTSKFLGAPVPVARISSIPTTRRHASSSSRNPAQSSPRSALVQKVTANELDSILSAERTSPMIIDFYATWCGPCVVLAQELEQLAVEYGEDIRFLKVDTDEEHELASQMEIRGLPTMVFVSKDVDKLAIRTEGLLPTDSIRDIIEKEILV